MRHQVQIAAANVPEQLAGAPLSVEIISQAGNHWRVLLPLSPTPVTQDVDGPGSYLIRAMLPSGRLIANTVTTPDTPNPQGDALAKAVLDLKEEDAISDFSREAESLVQFAAAIQASRAAAGVKDQALPAWLLQAAQDLAKRAWGSVAELAESGIRRLFGAVGLSYTATARDDTAKSAKPEFISPPRLVLNADRSAAPAAMSYAWGTFLRWDSAPAKQWSRFEIPKMVLRRGGVTTAGPDGSIPSLWQPGHLIEPHFIKIAEASADAGSLVVWLPGPMLRPARVVPDPDAAVHRSGSPLRAFLEPVDSITGTLFTYVRHGALDEARTTVPALLKMLEGGTATLGPNQGLQAAYVLYKLRDAHVEGLISRLRTQYPALPDVQVLAATQLIREGKTDEAIEPLTAALAHGAPVYTEGVRLLRDGTNFFRDLQPHEERFQHNARYAACIAAAANFQSELTCLQMGDDLVMEFVDS
jgi:hypothetical protein